ncbi:hypothetical protein [Pseudonocardia spinosispora]|uniref:hypothetical protein n=1 Tax=Pseudonocardia spinosispora TaxID=103441 RepID=UPI000428FCF4|nr:hypothetical protein [Pseudonocardia spinosispora]
MSAPAPTQQTGWSPTVVLALLISEFRKTFSTAAWWALLIPAVVLCALVGLALAEIGGLTFSAPAPQALALSSFGSKFAVVFGVVCASSEFRHRTITTSYLTAPGRPQLLVAKVVVAAVVGAGYGLACWILGLLGILAGGGQMTSDELSSMLAIGAVGMMVFALWAVIGVGVGTLIDNQVGAILGVLVYLLLAEGLITGVARFTDTGQIDEFLPGGSAAWALQGLVDNGAFSLSTGSPLPWWLALLIFFGYALVAVLAGAAVAQTRDVT